MRKKKKKKNKRKFREEKDPNKRTDRLLETNNDFNKSFSILFIYCFISFCSVCFSVNLMKNVSVYSGEHAEK